MVRIVRFAWDEGLCPVDFRNPADHWPTEPPDVKPHKPRQRRPNRRDGSFQSPDQPPNRRADEGRAA
jgi:hypothetical protein